jgi:hypothetical protein
MISPTNLVRQKSFFRSLFIRRFRLNRTRKLVFLVRFSDYRGRIFLEDIVHRKKKRSLLRFLSIQSDLCSIEINSLLNIIRQKKSEFRNSNQPIIKEYTQSTQNKFTCIIFLLLLFSVEQIKSNEPVHLRGNTRRDWRQQKIRAIRATIGFFDFEIWSNIGGNKFCISDRTWVGD